MPLPPNTPGPPPHVVNHNQTGEDTRVMRSDVQALVDQGALPADISTWLQNAGLDALSVNKIINDLPSYTRKA